LSDAEQRQKQRIIPVAIEDEMRESYLNYAMSVIVSRALPDVRDGLKPVHRRILYSMYEMGLRSDKAFKKCGRIVGDVLGKFHPHGDQSIYDALVRLAQDFSLRYPVVQPQGNFGSVDGDPAAAMRYTEARMAKIAEYLLSDINKETVDFGPNYDDSMEEPQVLPSAFPNLLVNGGSGIAVGMATNIAPHNLTEVCNAVCAQIENPEIEIDELMEYIKGPDFPTAGIICGLRGIKNAFRIGRGRITVRSRCSMDTLANGRDVIIVSELPYQVNKANLILKIADLVRDKKVDGIADLRDESDRDGMRIVIELKRTAVAKVVLNQLFTHTSLQQNFNVNNLALVDGRPKLLSLKEMIFYYIRHRKDVVIRRTQFDLRKAEERAHILEGLKIALDNIDEVIKIIKAAADVNDAREALVKTFGLSEIQAQAILDMRLQKLTNLETKKINAELDEIRQKIRYFKELLASESLQMEVVSKELREVAEKFGDPRRSEIQPDEVDDINIEDLIKEENVVVPISHRGFIKRVPASAYRVQGRGGFGAKAASLRDEDFVEHLFVASTHDHVLFVTSVGKAYWIKVHEIPEGSRISKGSHIKSLLAISADEDVTAIITFKDFKQGMHLFMATQRGVVKKVEIPLFVNAKTRGIAAIKLDDGDKLVSALLTSGEDEALLVTRKGQAVRFSEQSVRSMGRSSRGVCGIKVSAQDEVAGVLRVEEQSKILLITTNGFGKRVQFNSFANHSRATKGQICYKTNDKTGEIVGALSIGDNDDLMCITAHGLSIRTDALKIPVQGRSAAGVIVSALRKPDKIVSIAMTEKEEQVNEEGIELTDVTDEANGE
jgi:DNA gyrase subunit A